MKTKTTLIFLLIFSFFSYCQTTKGILTNLIFSGLYGTNANPDNYPAADYPLTFSDIQGNAEFTNKVKLLTYLEFQDGVPVLWRDAPQFRTDSYPYHTSVIKSFIEAWNVPLATSGSLPYNDVNVNTLYYRHILTAYNLGMLPNSSQLNPYDAASVNTTIGYFNFMNNPSNVSQPSQSTLLDDDNYFMPNVFTADNLGFSRGMQHGVFSHYAENSFVIPDRKMNLNFSHFYSTQMVEIPEAYYPIKPVGRGWSHTYNSYIHYAENAGVNGDDLFYIVWSDGSIHIYNDDDNEYITKSVYDDFDEDSSTRIYITKKNQVRYTYRKLDSARDVYYLTEIRDPNGNEININYENAFEADTKRIEDVEAPSGRKLEFTYNSNSDLIRKIEDPINRKIEFEYSALAANYYQTMVNFEDAKGNLTTYQYLNNTEYDQYLLKRIDLPRGNKIDATYDDDGKLESFQVNNDTPTTVDTDFDHANNVYTSEVKSTTPSGSLYTQDYTFNENGMVTDYSSDTNNAQASYPSSGVNVLRPTQSTSNGVQIDYQLDSRGNITEIDKENGTIIEEFEFDNDNNLTEYTDGEGNITKFFYDSDENLIRIEDAFGNSIYFTYDNHGQLLSKTNQEGITVNYSYTAFGAVSMITGEENISSSFLYDGVNRVTQRNNNGLISSYLYDDNDNITQFINSGGFATSYGFDPNDNLISITNANNIVTSFVYDDEDRVIQEQFGTLITQYSYGDEGYLEEITKPSGADKDFEYDNDGRLKETETITDIDYNSRNLVEDITNATGTMDFNYDILNRLEKVTTVHGHYVEYDYDDNNLVEELMYPTLNGIDVEARYQFDDKNRIWIVSIGRNVGSSNVVLAEYEYHDDDRIKWIDLGNGVRINYDYDNAGRLRFIQHENLNTNSVMYTGSHLLNPRGNIHTSNEYFTPLPSGHNSNIGNSATNTYTYDNNSQTILGNGESYNVNDDGNTISIGQNTSLAFDVEDRLTSYSNVDNSFNYKYNPYNQRVETTRNGVTKKYVRDVRLDNILVELDSNNNPIQYFIYAPNGMLICRMMPNGDLDYYHGDIRGSVVMITDENASITHQYRYNDFGTITRWSEPSNSNNPFRYVGIYGVEYETNDLYYMRARYYKPSIGRFLSEDPIWSTNLYPYADNNPISKIDPSGNIPVETILDVASIGVSATEFGIKPTWENAAYLAWDIGATFIPYLPGSYIRRATQLSKYSDETIQFGRNINQKNHAIRHVLDMGLDPNKVKGMIMSDVRSISSTLKKETLTTRNITIDGKNLQYNIYKLKDGTINIGRINEKIN